MRRLLLGIMVVLPVLPTAACAQSRPTELADRAAPGPRRMPTTFNEPLGLFPQAALPPRFEPAPVPNREIEAPLGRQGPPPAATLEPLMLPPERQQGVTFGREHLRETGPDRPFDTIVPGARLRIPFDSGIPGR